MIKYLTNSEIDKKKWDECIKNAVNGIVYANTWYLDIVGEEWSALVENDYERVFPLVAGIKWGVHYLYQPVFTQQLGVFSQSILTEEVVAKFLEAIPPRFKFAEINLNSYNKLPPGKHRSVGWINHELDLINDYQKTFNGFSTNLKRKIKKAEKSDLTVLTSVKPEEVIKIFQENKGKKLKNLKEVDYQKLRRLAYMGIYKGLIQNYGVYSPKNELCAGAIFIKSKHKTIFLFSGLTVEGRELNAMAMLISAFIEDHSQHPITLDFEGSNDPQLARFYKSFGAITSTYPHLEINNLPFLTKLAVRLVKTFR
ncbi:MAG: hypothetical protein K8R74_04950 [Bacteroidales bacterium]|nr:hypothetical protein [Bacteroidales bacterium]